MFERMYSTIGFLVQGDRAGGGGTLGSGVGQFERLFDLQIRQTFDFEDAAGEDVLLALLLDGQQALLDGVQRNGVDQVTQGAMPGCILPFEADQHRFRHVQRHHAGGGGESNQTGTGRERDADRETGVRSRHRCRRYPAAAAGGSARSG